jgi:glycosyltransferase involved in cell wall biosynthesis
MVNVSVIMPAYNAAKYIAEAIESLITQSFEDWELILVNDGSTDETLSIAQGYSDPRLKITTQKNQGEAGARNTGLELATGKYISFLDADDLYLPNALNSFVGYMDSHPEIDIAYSDGFICNTHGEPMMRLTEIRENIVEGYILESIVLSTIIITVPLCTILRRAAVESKPFRFDQNISYGTDWDFWIRISKYAKFGYINELTCKYRVHQTNMTRVNGVAKYRADLLDGRKKVLNSDWFHELSIGTRHQFFYNLLLIILPGQVDEQTKILNTTQFLDLPKSNQAQILRMVASDYILANKELDFAMSCLQESVKNAPSDAKSKYLTQLMTSSPLLGRTTLTGYRTLSNAKNNLKKLFKDGPKPVPVELVPIGDPKK